MKKLIEALHVIQDECKKHYECESCPMHGHGNTRCNVRNSTPNMWKIKNDREQKDLFESQRALL